MTRILFALRRGAPLVLSLTLALGLAACAGGDTESSSAGNGGGASAAASAGGDAGGGASAGSGGDATAEVTAENIEFSVDTITAPANETFTVAFTNNEAVPHNFSVYTEQGGEEIAIGDVIGEGETDEVTVESLEAGEYFFVCDVHASEMTGTLVVED